MPDIPYIEPLTIGAGDTVTWKHTDTLYPPADGWVLTYKLRSATVVYTVTCTTSGTDYLATITAATSAAYVAGAYTWVRYVTRTVDAVVQQHTTGNGNVTILPNLTTSALVDPRTDARIIYDDLIVAYKSYVSTNGTMAAFSVAGKSVSFNSAADIIKQIEHWRIIVQREEDAAKIALGFGNPRRVGTRFNRI